MHPPAAPHAPYDLLYLGAGGVPVYVLARSYNGKVGVTVRATQHAALAQTAERAGGIAAYYIVGALVALSDLVGIAHVHIHHLDATTRSIVFRVVNGKPAPPRWCFGKCDGPLRDD